MACFFSNNGTGKCYFECARNFFGRDEEAYLNEEMSPEHLDQVQAALFTLGVWSISPQFHLKSP